MNILVVYDSMYGNTEKIARAIATGLKTAGKVQLIRAGEVDPQQLEDVDLLVVGSPTQAFAPIAGAKDFLNALPAKRLNEIKIAAFDTRMDVEEVDSKLLTFMAGILGYAAEKLAKGLIARGGIEVVPAAGFFVEGKEGPLKEGELERASDWAGEILQHC